MAFGLKLFSMFGEILVDSKKALNGLDKVDGRGKKVAKMFGSLVKGVAKFTAIGATVGIAVVGGLAKIATKAAAVTDRIDKLSQRLGLSRKAFQEWEFAMSQNGVTMESVQAGMKVMVQKLDDLEKGVGIGVEAFDKLGLKWEDLEGMNQEEVFAKIIEKFNEMPDGINKANLAQEIFSRSGQEMLPILNQSVESVEALKQEARDLGLVLSDEAVDAGVQFTDTMDKLKRSFGAAFTTIGTDLIPIFEKMANWIISNMPIIKKVVGVVFTRIWNVISRLWTFLDTYMIPLFKVLFSWIQDKMPIIKKTTSDVFERIKEVINNVWDFLEKYFIPILRKFFGWIKENMPVIKETISKVFSKILEVVTNVWEFYKEYFLPILVSLFNWVVENMPTFKAIFESVFKLIKLVVEKAWDIFERFFLPILKVIFGWIRDHMPQIKETMTTVFQVIQAVIEAVVIIVEAFFDILEKVWNWVKGTFSSIGKNIKTAFEGVTDFIQKIVDVITKVIDKIKKVTDAVKNFFSSAAKEEEKYVSNSTLGSGNFKDAGEPYKRTPKEASVTEMGGYSRYGSTTNVTINNNNNPDADEISRQVKRTSELQAMEF
jgi:phage-related protein